MKLNIEIIKDKFIYDYHVSEVSKCHGEMSLSAENYLRFAELLKVLVHDVHQEHDEKWKKLMIDVAMANEKKKKINND